VALWLLVALDAWREGAGHGLLTTLIPPYAFIYAGLRSEHTWLKSLVLSAAVMLAAEFYFLGSAAMLHEAQTAINRGIEAVGGRIERAGDPLPD